MGCSPNICFKNNRLYLCPRRPCSLKWWHTTGQKCPVVCRTMLGCVQVGSVVWRVTRELVKKNHPAQESSGTKSFKKVCQFSANCLSRLVVLKFPHSKFRFSWTNISLFVSEFLPWSVSHDVRGSQRCFVNKACLGSWVPVLRQRPGAGTCRLAYHYIRDLSY